MVSADWCGFCTWTAPTPCVVSPGSDCRRMNGVGAFGMCLRGLCWFAQFVTMTQAQVTTCSTCVPASLYDVRADVKPQLEIGRRYEVFSPRARCAWRRPVHALLAVARPRRMPGLAVVLSSHILFRWSVLCVLCGVSLNLWVNQIVVVCGKIVLAGLVRPDSGGMVLCMICLRRFASLRSAALVLARLPRWRVLGRCVSSVFCCGAMSWSRPSARADSDIITALCAVYLANVTDDAFTLFSRAELRGASCQRSSSVVEGQACLSACAGVV